MPDTELDKPNESMEDIESQRDGWNSFEPTVDAWQPAASLCNPSPDSVGKPRDIF